MRLQRQRSKDFEEVVIDSDEPVFTSSVVCRLIGVPIWVLKQLDTEGIVCPERENSQAARLYSKRELNKVKHCWFYMKERQVKIGGLKVILEMEQA